MTRLFRALDWPPVWLAGFLIVAWALQRVLPAGPFGGAGRLAGGLLGGAGVALMVAAAVQMAAARTTVIPRRDPAALVTSGVFRISRNPIYLGDALVLAGAILWWDLGLALPLVPAFVLIINRRFILDEEARLRAAFGPEFAAWARRTRRWL